MNRFSVVMFICEVLIPVMMIVIGAVFIKMPPKEINSFYGYRTKASMKSKDAWDFAHKYCGKLLVPIGLITFFPSLILAVFVFNMSENIIGAVAATLCILQTVPFIVVIALTENAISKNFDKNGSRIEKK
ncbi:MAG: SdpI family protein [Ruminococcaceae bacterium]|nr:SdpI family protein [Oscillospiraceae bacterium]